MPGSNSNLFGMDSGEDLPNKRYRPPWHVLPQAKEESIKEGTSLSLEKEQLL